MLLTAGAAQAADIQPVEGTWNLADGQVTVAADGSGAYSGTVTQTVRFSSCPHAVGEVIWRLSGSGAAYRGTHQWIASEGETCLAAQPGYATWSISEDATSFTMRFCTNSPGMGVPSGDSGSYCADLSRAKPPLATPTAAASGETPVAGQVLLSASPAVAQEVAGNGGCLTRTAATRVFTVTAAKLVPPKKGAKRPRDAPRLVSLTKTLDGRRLGRLQRKPPFRITLSTAVLEPGTHTLRVSARVRLRKSAAPVVRRLSFRFSVCR